MRAKTAKDVGLVIRERRRTLGLTQQQLADLAEVGRPWLVAVEGGHQRAELDRVLRTLAVLDLVVDVSTIEPGPVNLDDVLDRLQHDRGRSHG